MTPRLAYLTLCHLLSVQSGNRSDRVSIVNYGQEQPHLRYGNSRA